MEGCRPIGRRLMVGISGDALDEETRRHLKFLCPGAVILFSRNIRNPAQVAGLIGAIKDSVNPAPLIAVDQEGGLVVRFLRDVTVMPGNMALGATGSSELAYAQARCVARELKALGIDINLAPVVDVATNPDNPGITIRSFGADPVRVAEFGVEYVRGVQSEGLGAVAKHFPGKGAAGKDAHFDLPVVETSWEEMERIHLHPFMRCVAAGVRGVMSSHVVYCGVPGVEQTPATFADALIRVHLRDRIGFRGVVFSDDLEMGAISKFFRFEEAVARSATAGHDMLLICSDYNKQRQALSVLVDMVGSDVRAARENEESIKRIDALVEFCRRGKQTRGTEDGATGVQLAARIAERSITVLRGELALPVKAAHKKVCVILPDLGALESVEAGFEANEGNVVARMAREKFKGEMSVAFLPLEPQEGDIERAWAETKDAEVVLGFVFNARFLKGQRALLERLHTISPKAVAVLIRNPFDCEFCRPALTTVISYGYRRVQMEAAVKVITGEISAQGKLPIKEYRA